GLRAPNLAAGIDVACEDGRPGRSVARRECSASRSRLGMFETVSVDYKPANVLFLQQLIDSGRVGAFRQPEANWFSAKSFTIAIATESYLGAGRTGRLVQNRQETVGRRTRNDLDGAAATQLSEESKQIVIPFLAINAPGLREKITIKFRKGEHGDIGPIALAFAFGQGDEPIEMLEVTLTQQFILEHCAKSGCDRHCDFDRNAFVEQALKHP